MIHRKRRPNKKAFTILEVMMAAAVMLAGVVGMIQVVASCAEMNDLAKKQTIAAQIIQDQIGKVHVVDWTTVSAYPASTVITIDPSFTRSFQSLVCTRYAVDDPVRTNLRKITFTITWQTGNVGRVNYARNFSRSGSTYVAKNGLYVTYQRS
jgi:Tfp pilus assembly protein PilV